jgi:hypothetical protein
MVRGWWGKTRAKWPILPKDNNTTAGRWVEKRDDNAGGRALHSMCGYRSSIVKRSENCLHRG